MPEDGADTTRYRSRPRLRDSLLTGGLLPEDTHGGREGESASERVDRELIELLNEIRVVLPGVQVLFAFLFAAPFATGWKQVTDLQRDVYLAAVLCAALATAFLVAPTTYHRLTFRMGFKERLIRFGNVCVLVGTLMLAASMSMAVFVVTAIVVDDTWALILGGGVALVLLALWYVLPLSLRERDEDRRERERDAHPSHL
jgi:O-antigen/teichoic acid export membrane protein